LFILGFEKQLKTSLKKLFWKEFHSYFLTAYTFQLFSSKNTRSCRLWW